jgi:hypothetical protein
VLAQYQVLNWRIRFTILPKAVTLEVVGMAFVVQLLATGNVQLTEGAATVPPPWQVIPGNWAVDIWLPCVTEQL